MICTRDEILPWSKTGQYFCSKVKKGKETGQITE